MCRVAAIIQPGDTKVSPVEVKNLLLNMEYMGKDATGIAFIGDNGIQFTKSPGKASDLVNDGFEDKIAPYVANSNIILLHTRAATHGKPENNNNNHPIFGNRYVLVHNGVVHLNEKFKAVGETDSEQLLRSIEKYGFKPGIENSYGWASVIFADCIDKQSLYFYKTFSSDLVFAEDKRNILYLASTENIIKKSIESQAEYEIIKSGKLYKMNVHNPKVDIECNLDFNYATKTYSYEGKIYQYKEPIAKPKAKIDISKMSLAECYAADCAEYDDGYADYGLGIESAASTKAYTEEIAWQSDDKNEIVTEAEQMEIDKFNNWLNDNKPDIDPYENV